MTKFLGKLVLLIFVLSASAYADFSTFRAMTINTEWLWTPFDRKVDGRIKHLKDMSAEDYLNEIRFYAKQIQARNIDIVALSEIENEQVAKELARKLGPEWGVYFKQGRDTATGQDVAIISRLSYVNESLTDFNFPSGYITGEGKAKRLSKIVGAQFWIDSNLGKKKLGLITAHLLSKRNENKKKAVNREKQALGLKKAIENFLKTSDAIIVMGDFNDYLNSATMNIIIDKHLSTYKACRNFMSKADSKLNKRWLKHIDHLLYSGLDCLSQYQLDLQSFSDHPGIYGEFTFHQSK